MAGTLERLLTLHSLSAPWEVVVVSDGGGTVPMPLGEHTVMINRPHQGSAAARNYGAEVARGEYLVFLDDDTEPGDQWSHALRQAQETEAVAVTGPICARDQSLLSKARAIRYERRYSGLSCGDQVNFFAGGNSLVRRDAFLSAGGFPSDGPGSDNLLAQRLPKKPLFCWGMWVSHRNDRGYRNALRAAANSGWADARRRLPAGSPAVSLRNRSALAPSLVNLGLHSMRLGGWVSGSLLPIRAGVD